MDMDNYIIKKEMIGGIWHYLIYAKVFFGLMFIEKWDDVDSAKERVIELEYN